MNLNKNNFVICKEIFFYLKSHVSASLVVEAQTESLVVKEESLGHLNTVSYQVVKVSQGKEHPSYSQQ